MSTIQSVSFLVKIPDRFAEDFQRQLDAALRPFAHTEPEYGDEDPQDKVARWRDEMPRDQERQVEYWKAICRVLGLEIPAETKLEGAA